MASSGAWGGKVAVGSGGPAARVPMPIPDLPVSGVGGYTEQL